MIFGTIEQIQQTSGPLFVAKFHIIWFGFASKIGNSWNIVFSNVRVTWMYLTKF